MNTTLTIAGIAIYMVAMFLIGWAAYRRNKANDADDWFVMGRSANLFMLVGTLFATWFSTFAFLGGPGTFYLTGVNWLLFGFFNSMGPVLVMIFGPRIWTLGKRFGFITPADLLASYYDDSRRLRLLTGLVCIAVLFPYAAIQLSGISVALNSISHGLISYETGIIGLAVCVGVYAIFGGSRAVVWTDAVQGIIFAALLIGGAIAVVHWSGGWQTGWSNAVAAAPDKFMFGENTKQGTYITLLILWTFGWILTPHLWQRLYMAESPRTLLLGSVITSFLALFVVTFSGAVIGMLAIGMNVAPTGSIVSDALVPMIFAKYLPIFGVVLVIAVFAAGMSTLDSQIISASSNFTQDLYGAMPKLDQSRKMKASRYFEIAFVVAVVLFSLSEAGRQLLIPLASIGVGMALVFLMPLIGALFWPRASEPAAFWSMLCGWGVMMAMQFKLFALPGSIGPALWGLIVSVVLFYGISFATAPVSLRKRQQFQDDMLDVFPETRVAQGKEASL
ncbi:MULTISPECIES: sodium:solute symporter family protein [unclassified Xanthobacter]|uniref:sodium:solute symporter family protein n=1 Tax=unclassified Xanthobacter TaxID=2623496 RepID=UPI001EE0C43A|nr:MULTISPECIES: sodium:solute symporter family protein [unclassified Xanthobacter]